jgi:hypothetical protein
MKLSIRSVFSGSGRCFADISRGKDELTEDGGGDFYDQAHFCRWAEVQSGTRFLSEHYFRRFYRVGSAVGRCFHGAVHGLVSESTCE